jgi:alkylation response protein AidB-like acyl-CoA dehydrogenase
MSSAYVPPLEEMRFVIEQVLDAPASWRGLPLYADLDADTAREVLAQAGRFAAEVIAPINASADLEGCHWTPESVTTPQGYPQAWTAFVEGGWPALGCDPEVGGQGLPQLLNAALFEMLVAANHAWTMYPGLLHGAYEAIKATATPELRERYLPKVVSGEWLATMNLTEPQAGSDLGLIRSRAEPVELGAVVENGAPVLVSGNKIFISGGDQDMTDNIVHLVLARLPDAPLGTKGLSLFLVPKFMPDGRRNAVFCDGIEKKMGIKGSSTCQMRFERAEGWLLGEPGAGLGAMFLMMNAARLHVGVQGLGHLDAATQKALRYAEERVQLRAPKRPDEATGNGADPIVWHPAMRRILLGLQAQTQGARVLAYWTALLLDEHEQHPDAQRRRDAGELVALLTPVVKAFLTHLGHYGADEALGVFGGYGYIHEYGIEQQVRDSRIAMIYEGTNEIQAIDLVMRKLLLNGGAGRGLALLQAEFSAEIERLDANAALAPFAAALRQQAEALQSAVAALVAARAADPEAPLRVADDMLHGVGHALLAWAWCRIARAALALDDASLRQAKLDVSRYGIDWLLPAARWRWQRVQAAETLVLPWVRSAG